VSSRGLGGWRVSTVPVCFPLFLSPFFVSSPHPSTFSLAFHSNPYSTSRSDESGGQRHDHGQHEDEAAPAPNASFAAGCRPVPVVQTLNHTPSAPHAAAFNISLHIFPAVVSVGLLSLGIDYLPPVGQPPPPCTSLPFLPSVLPLVSPLRTQKVKGLYQYISVSIIKT
jgi:hypothetical protein